MRRGFGSRRKPHDVTSHLSSSSKSGSAASAARSAGRRVSKPAYTRRSDARSMSFRLSMCSISLSRLSRRTSRVVSGVVFSEERALFAGAVCGRDGVPSIIGDLRTAKCGL